MTPEEKYKLKRDASIRFRFMHALQGQQGNQHGGWCTARFLIEVATGYFTHNDKPESDDHAMLLLRNLVAMGYIVEEDNREDIDQPFIPEHITFKLAGDGVRFMNRDLPATKMIKDGRVAK